MLHLREVGLINRNELQKVDTPGPSQAVGQAAETCFHCGLPVPAGVHYSVDTGLACKPVCCPGCRAVASSILGQGLGDYYRIRDAAAETVSQRADTDDWSSYDDPNLQQGFVRRVGDNKEVVLLLEGIRCSACVWLNEQVIGRMTGVLSANVNYATHRAQIRWNPQILQLSAILKSIKAIGYSAHPYDARRVDLVRRVEQRRSLGRLFVAGLSMMQVMMYAVPVYLSDAGDMSWDIEQLFRWAGLVLTLPVMLYSAAPFFRGAARDLKLFRLGMDVPVALGLGIAFGASVIGTVFGGGGVYYDSISMFVCLMLLGRYLELLARQRATRALQHLGRLAPEFAERLPRFPASVESERVSGSLLRPGDHVIVSTGQQIPADGIVECGEGSVDEALLSGEARPIGKKAGDPVTGGGVNLTHPLIIRITHVGADTVLSGIARLVERAAGERHPLAVMADRAAGIFIFSVIALSCIAAGYWMVTDPTKVIWVTVSVMVATCPCAFSLATPVALTAATGELARRGFVVTRAHAVETLARATDMVLDKTGTLTCGEVRMLDLVPLGVLSHDRCLQVAAALETGAAHPIAAAVGKAARRAELGALVPEAIESFAGEGVAAVVDGRQYRLGSSHFVERWVTIEPVAHKHHESVFLADKSGLLAALTFGDELRPDAAAAVAELRKLGLKLHLVTGDAEGSAHDIAAKVGIDRVVARVLPQGKYDYVRELQSRGAVVVMVGDGINDAPVLAQADVSVAMGGGAHLAQVQGDAVLVSGRLKDLAWAARHTRKALWIIRQNIAWAFAYNLTVLPFALAGVVAPWAAAIGMSASSLLVVLNALRLVSRQATVGESGRSKTGLASA